MVEISEKMIRNIGVSLCVVCFLSFYYAGERSQTRSQKRIISRLTASKARMEQCNKELSSLKGDMKLQIETEVTLAEEEGDTLRNENDMLMEEIEDQKDANYRKEEEIDDLRDQLNEQDFVADTDAEGLFDISELGNNTESLRKLLDSAEKDGEIKKGPLMERLIDEIKVKRLASRQCRTRLTTVAENLEKLTGQDTSSLVNEIFGEWDDYLRFTGAKDKVALTKAISEKAAENARKSNENKDKGIVAWDDFYDDDKDFADWKWGDDEEKKEKGEGGAAVKDDEDDEDDFGKGWDFA